MLSVPNRTIFAANYPTQSININFIYFLLLLTSAKNFHGFQSIRSVSSGLFPPTPQIKISLETHFIRSEYKWVPDAISLLRGGGGDDDSAHCNEWLDTWESFNRWTCDLSLLYSRDFLINMSIRGPYRFFPISAKNIRCSLFWSLTYC